MTQQGIQPLIAKSKPTLIALLSRNLSPDTTKEQLEAIIDQEIFNFEYIFIFNPEYLECESMSIQNAFRQTIMQNLSFDKDLGLVYMISRNYSIQGKQMKVLERTPSANGWVSIYRQLGALTDVDTSNINYNPTTGLVEKVRIGLTVPKYSNSGEITGEEKKWHEFGLSDFKLWETKSHSIKVSPNNPGNSKTLNLAGENYRNYAPKGISLDGKAFKDGENPTADKKGGINPSFAITKCLGHALKREKLERSPYAKRFIYLQHKRYVDDLPEEEVLAEQTFVVEKVIPDFVDASPDEVQETKKQIDLDKYDFEKVNKNVELAKNLAKRQDIINEAKSCNTKEEVNLVYKKYREIVQADSSLLKELVNIGNSKDSKENPIITSKETPKEDSGVNKVITSDDL